MIEAIFLDPWSWILPTLLFIAVLTLAVGIIFAILGSDFGVLGIVLGAILTPILGGFYFAAYLPPYDTSFYYTYKITGGVTELETAFSGDEGTMSQTFIAKVEGVDYYIRSDDQRFRTLNEGDDANLVCGKKFAYFQEPWYDCSFGG